MDSKEVLACEQVAIELAFEAGKMMMAASGNNKQIDQKISFADLVTETDKAVEAFLFTELRKKFPSHKFIGEETTEAIIEWTEQPTWIIDPVDGTSNFVHTFPFACVSIGLSVNKELTLGVIYSPFLEKLYTARKGCGAYCNGRPIRVRPCNSLKEALIMSEFGSSRDDEKRKAVFRNMEQIVWNSHGLRSLGSAALNVCMIATGGADAYYEFGLHCWDMAGAAVILTEAGGTVIDTKGGPLDIMSRRIIAAGSAKIAKDISEAIAVHLELQRD